MTGTIRHSLKQPPKVSTPMPAPTTAAPAPTPAPAPKTAPVAPTPAPVATAPAPVATAPAPVATAPAPKSKTPFQMQLTIEQAAGKAALGVFKNRHAAERNMGSMLTKIKSEQA